MIKGSKNSISKTLDQLLNATYKIQNCYQQRRYYHNDLFYRCNMKTKQFKRHKKRNRNKIKNRHRNRRGKKKPKTKYLNSSKSYSTNIFRRSRSSCNCVANVYYCTNYNKCSKVNLKICYQISNYLRYIRLYFQKQYNNFQLVIVLILLALITTTAHSIDTQGKSQQKLTTTSPPFDAAASMTAVNNLNESLNTISCHHMPNTTVHANTEYYVKFGSNICHKLRHVYHRYRNGQRHLQFHTRNILTNLHLLDKNSSKWLNINKLINFKTNYYNKQNSIHIHYQHVDNDFPHHIHQNDTATINKQQQSYNKNGINIENKMGKQVEEHLHKIKNMFQHIPTNKRNKNNNNYNKTLNDTLTVLKSSKEIRKEKNANVIINDSSGSDINNLVEDDVDDNGDHNDRIGIKSFETSLNILPPAAAIMTKKTANFSLHFIYNQQQQQPYIDHMKLMKLVMDGLGLKNLPNMEKVNISQEEYFTKYREYLQRVHKRKYHEICDVIDEYDKNFPRPLGIFSIVSNSTLLSQHQEHNKIVLMRQKRNVLGLNNEIIKHDDDDDDEDRQQTLEERIRNVLFLKKKYQKPRSTKKEGDEHKTNIRLMFALKPEILNLSSSDIEEANIRLVLIHSPFLAIRNSRNKKTRTKPKSSSCSSNKSVGQKKLHQVNILNLKLYFLSKAGKRILLDGRKIDIHVDLTKPDETHTLWLQFDVSKAVKTSIDDKRLQHVVLELQCDNCKRIGARILNDAYNTAADALADDLFTEGHQLMPVLNIIGHFNPSQRSMRPYKHESQHSDSNEEATTQHHYHHQTNNSNKNRHNRRTNCHKANQRCCRHSMEVTFKEIKGFEFIIQPKVFDAGYCHGRCPPRYNPAHHHALLQSLIWKQNHHKAPRPCCAPSKLVELEVLHVDEKDSEKLKISTWSDMKVVECACS